MLHKLFKSSREVGAKPDVRQIYNAQWFDGRHLLVRPDSEFEVLVNLQIQGEVVRRDMNERLDTLIELQRELLATQQAILSALQKPDRA